MWVFGYGSLMWRPGFDYLERHIGYVRGWSRRFYQGSTDHRGVPGAPGRVVTLIPEEGAVCWGVAYRMDLEEADLIGETLDYREKGGYSRHRVTVIVRPEAGGVTAPDVLEDVLLYVASPGNPNYLGRADVEHIAQQVAGATGPSGRNIDYVLMLAKALREMGVEDPHVFEVERAVRQRSATY